MTGRFWALKAARISPATTARLIAPITTGLRSRNGTLMSFGVPSESSAGGAKRGKWATSWGKSSQLTPVGAGVVLHRDGQSGDGDLALELAEVEVEPRAVDRGAADLLELDRQHLQGPVDLGLATVEVLGHGTQLLDVLDER